MDRTRELIQSVIQKKGAKRQSLLPILHSIKADKNHISKGDMIEIAQALDLSSAEVYGTASFYSFLSTKPLGKYVIRVCKTIVCDMQGKQEIIETMESILKIKVGETTINQKFSLLTTNCLGWCHKGPVMLINDKVYTEMTPEKVSEILHDYIRNK